MGSKKLRVVLVGPSGDQMKNVATGGQSTACRILLDSQLSKLVQWTLVDTTIESLFAPPFYQRLLMAIKRTITFLGIMLKSKLDVVLIFTSWGYSILEKGTMVFIARLFGKNVILSPRSGLILNDLEKSRFMRWFYPFVFRQCNIVMCQTRSWMEFYQSISGLPDNRFVVIPNWIDSEPYQQIVINRKRIDNRVNILFLGRIERNKGVYVLSEAVQIFRNELENCHFIICGMGSELESFKDKINNLKLSPLFEFRGWVTGHEKIKALQEADIFVIPSYREGLPNSLLEAMASGLAVIATEIGGIPDILDDNKGRLIQPGNVKALGLAIVELSKSVELRTRLGEAARNYILENHDIAIVWPKVLNMLQMNNK